MQHRPSLRLAQHPGHRGFSLLEMLVATTVLLLMLAVIFKITQGTADAWRSSTGKIEGFREARSAFESITRAVSQATLNTYFDYVDSSGNYMTSPSTFKPEQYARRSDLQFVCGKKLLAGSSVSNPTTHALFFLAPLGYTHSSTYEDMESLLNACGFYICYSADLTKPGFLSSINTTNRYRFRLVQFTQPAQNLSIYDSSVTGSNPAWNNTNWFLNPLEQDLSSSTPSTFFQLAENIVALIVLPKYSATDETASGSVLSPDYEYNSRNRSNPVTLHQLPPVIQIVLVAIDEASAVKLGNSPTPPNLGLSSLFQTSSQLAEDLGTLGNNLAALPGNAAGNKIPLRYEIFQIDIAIRGAKWSN